LQVAGLQVAGLQVVGLQVAGLQVAGLQVAEGKRTMQHATCNMQHANQQPTTNNH
jgi:hypothetical protein